MDSLCFEKELKVRISELLKYRENGLMKSQHLVAFEKLRYRREARKEGAVKLLPRHQDYSLKAMLPVDISNVSKFNDSFLFPTLFDIPAPMVC